MQIEIRVLQCEYCGGDHVFTKRDLESHIIDMSYYDMKDKTRIMVTCPETKESIDIY